MKFNITKCVVLCICEAVNYMYNLDGIPLATEPLQNVLCICESVNYMYTLDGIPLATEPLQNVLCICEAVNYMYTLDGIPLATEPLQKDLGVIFSDILKPSAHITSVTKRANQHIGLINYVSVI